MTFKNLLEKLHKQTFEQIVNDYCKEKFKEPTNVECIENEVYEDEDLYEFLKELNAEIVKYDVHGNETHKYALIKTSDNECYEIPYENRTNRFDNDLPDETIFNFDINAIQNVTEQHI